MYEGTEFMILGARGSHEWMEIDHKRMEIGVNRWNYCSFSTT